MSIEAPVVQARFRRPLTPSDFTPRAQLTKRLDRISQFPLTVVAAPAGMGKTSALANWLDSVNVPYVWLTLDDSVSSPEAFVRTLIAGLQTHHPEFGLSILTEINGVTLPSPDLLAANLAMQLLPLEQRIVIVLDDYEAIHDPTTHQIIRSLVPLLPATAHLVVASRTTPPLPLARLRAQGQVLDISTDDLRLGQQEAQRLLDQIAGRPLKLGLVDDVLRETEGWPFALRLAGLALRGDAHPDTILAALTASSRSQILDFLLEEVYSQQPPAVQDLLLKTSILERLTPSLCDAILASDTPGELTGQAFVEGQRRTNLLTALDDPGGSFRYHSLLRMALGHRLRTVSKPGEIKALHERAARWFAENGDVGQAIPHFLAAGQVEQAVQLVEANLLRLIANEDNVCLERWLDLLPVEAVGVNPLLLACRAWLINLRQGFVFLLPLFQKIELLLEESDRVHSTWPKEAIQALYAIIAAPFDWINGNVETALARAHQARLAVDATYAPIDGWAILHESVSLHLAGEHDAALDLLHAALADGTYRNEDLMVSHALYGLAFVHWLSGDLLNMETVCHQLLQIHSKAGRHIGVGWANFMLGALYYEWNQLDKAGQHFDEVIVHRHEVNHRILPDTVFLNVRIRDLEGRPEAADTLLDGLENVAWDTTNLPTLRLAASFRAQRAAAFGNVADAERWLSEAKAVSETSPMIFLQVPQVTQAKVLLARRTQESAWKALENLAHLEQVARSFSNTRALIEILSLSAVAYCRLGLVAEAVPRLEEAVTLGEPGRFTRTFLDLGPEMAHMLSELASREVAKDYIGYLLRQFAITPSLSVVEDRGAVRRQQAQAQLIEPLTEREMDVLALLVQRQSYQEIAQALVITRATVKAHTVHIYQKLGVSSRREAILVTQRLGLLDIH